MKKLFVILLLVILIIVLTFTRSGFGATISNLVLPQNVASVNLTLTINGNNYTANGVSFFGLTSVSELTIINYYAGGTLTSGTTVGKTTSNPYIQWQVTGKNSSGIVTTIKNTDNGTSGIIIPYSSYVPSGADDNTNCIGNEYTLYGFTSAQQMANAVCNSPGAVTLGYGSGASTTGTACTTTTGSGMKYNCNVPTGNVSIVVPPFINTATTTYTLTYLAYTHKGIPMAGSNSIPLGGTNPNNSFSADTFGGNIVITLAVKSGSTTTTTYYIWTYGTGLAYGAIVTNYYSSVPKSQLSQQTQPSSWPSSGPLSITIPSINVVVTVGSLPISNITLS